MATFPFLSSLDQVRFTSTDPASAALVELPVLGSINPRLTRARRDSLMAPLNMDRRRGIIECPRPSDFAIILSKELTQSQLGRLICSLALHISLMKTAYRAPSNQASTVYPSEPMRVTSCTAVKGSVFMVPSVTRSVMSSASSSNVVGFARLLSVRCRIDR